MKKRLTALCLLLTLLFSCAAADGLDYSAFWIIADSDTRLLSEEELWRFTRETLRYIRNEILARAGYAFESPKFYDYFNAKPWYTAGGYGKTRSLSQEAWNNISIVKRVEREMDQLGVKNENGISIEAIVDYQNRAGGYGNMLNYGNARGGGGGLTLAETDPAYARQESRQLPQPTVSARYAYSDQYIIPDSDWREITEGELWGYTRETLRYIRNEILARHGYPFTLEKFAAYFGAKTWYTPGGYDQAVLSRVEWNNIARVKRVEKQMDELGTQNPGGLDISTIVYNQMHQLYPGK